MKNLKIIVFVVLIVLVSYFVFFKQKAMAPVDNNPPVVTNPQISVSGKANKDDLVLFSIAPGAKVSGKVEATGVIKGAYFFEANIITNILDGNKNMLKQGHGDATTDWMTSDPVSFKTSLDFTGLPAGPAYIEIRNDNPSGLPENDKSILIPIIIQ